ncbi:MAG: DUF4857 domain-containing protein [Odoribacteraceae bacterium]|nr:DUF4857 domain-containing protein [Odoribacteraceae bacterium]
MKKTTIHVLLLLFITGIAAWALPALSREATHLPGRYPFIYYSSLLKELCIIDYGDEETPLTTLSGQKYTEAECDSLLPLLNFRQLMSDGKLPDTIDGIEITPPLLRSKSMIFRYNPIAMRSPRLGLHILYESMPRRVGIEMPGDLFRLEKRIEFIHCETNRIDHEKSARFQHALDRRGYRFPARWSSGNPNPRKAYDEGYFSLDHAGHLFHIKMVNGRPYVRDTRVHEHLDPLAFSMLEVSDKRFYGFLFGKAGDVYILEARDGRYHPVPLDLPPFDALRDQLVIMGNLLYWNVSVTTPAGRSYYALRTSTLERVAEHHVTRPPDPSERLAAWIFPFHLTFVSPDSAYLYPRLHINGPYAWLTNILLAALVAIFVPGTRRQRVFHSSYILIMGIAGFFALLALPYFITNNPRK